MDSTWLANPQDSDTPSFGDDEIRGTRVEFHDRLTKEHVIGGTTAADGAHKKGSARVYHQATAPSLRPDGSSSLDSDDDGRLWIDEDDGKMQYWDGSAMAELTVAHTEDTVTDVSGHANQIVDQAGGDDVLCRVVSFSSWNMDTTSTHNFAHGLTASTIVSMTGILSNNAGTAWQVLSQATGAGQPRVGFAEIGLGRGYDGTTIYLARTAGTIFDSANYNAASGKITIWYQP